jgi:Leucine-rich repeat (LRR) protein
MICNWTNYLETIDNLSNIKEFIIPYMNKIPGKSIEDSRRDILNMIYNINKMKNIEIINLSGCHMNLIHDNVIRGLNNLLTLHLYDANLLSFPEIICSLTALKKLELGYNKITQIPESIGNLVNLKKIGLESNLLILLPENIYNLPKLKYLYIQNNKLKTISKKINNIKRVYINIYSYENLDNMPNDGTCEYLQIHNLHIPLKNLPLSLLEIRLYRPEKINIKLPYNCNLYIDNILQKN